MNSEKKLKILDIILVSLIAVMLLVIMGLVIFQPADHKLVRINRCRSTSVGVDCAIYLSLLARLS